MKHHLKPRCKHWLVIGPNRLRCERHEGHSGDHLRDAPDGRFTWLATPYKVRLKVVDDKPILKAIVPGKVKTGLR